MHLGIREYTQAACRRGGSFFLLCKRELLMDMNGLILGGEGVEETYWRFLERMDAESFRHLMAAYGEDVWNLAYLITKKHDLADDVTQETFISAYNSIHTFRGQSTLRTWLLSITRNKAINCVRSAFLRKVTFSGVGCFGSAQPFGGAGSDGEAAVG